MAIAQTDTPKINDKREIFGWAMYDWANSAFSTTIGTVFLGPYLASLAAKAASLSPDKHGAFLGHPGCTGFVLPILHFLLGLDAGALPAHPGCHRGLFPPPQADDAVVCHHRRSRHHPDVLRHRAAVVAGRCAVHRRQPGVWRLRSSSTIPTCRILPVKTSATGSLRMAGRWATWATACC